MAKLTEKDIERFAGLQGIRKKPVIYVGPVDENGLWTIWREPGDNTVDRALAGQNSLTHLIEDSEPNTYWVQDEGDGIPVGKKEFEDEKGKKEKLSTLFVVTGLTHGGSNFSGDQISRGTHGIGIKATNALSSYFKLWTHREGKWWAIEYKKGKLTKDVHESKAPKLPHSIKATKGTIVCFKPDEEIFKKSKMPMTDTESWCELTSFLVPKLKILLTNKKGKTKTFITKKGPVEYLDKQKETLKCEYDGKPFVYSSKLLDVVLGFSDANGDNLVKAYTNGLSNIDGGKHVEAMQKALYDSLKSFRSKKQVFKKEDLLEGLVGLVNAKISAPTFSNQRKDKLTDDRIVIAYEELLPAFQKFWNENKALAKRICSQASELRSRTADFLKDKKLIKNVNSARKKMSAKLADVVGNAPIEQRELFLVEGDSAGGTSKRARNKEFQAVFPLKGKPLNVHTAKKDKINNNKEITGILAAIGLDMNAKSPVDKVRYGKIIFLADGDDDGHHINALLLGLFWKYLPDLYKKGKIYLVDSPKFWGKHKGKVYFAHTKEKLYKKAGTRNIAATYLKGWGELDAEVMKPLIFDPETRKLVQILPPKGKKEAKEFTSMLSSDKELLRKDLGLS